MESKKDKTKTKRKGITDKYPVHVAFTTTEEQKTLIKKHALMNDMGMSKFIREALKILVQELETAD